MSGLSPHATRDDIEEEILFQDVLITSLDGGASDYEQQLSELQATKRALEKRLEDMDRHPQRTSNASYMNGMGLDGTNDQHTSPQQRGYIANGAGYGLPSANSSNKRPAPYPAFDEHPSKRPTPEASAANTPSSSSSFEFVDHPGPANAKANAERARQRQLQAEAALRRRREEQRVDENFARSLSQSTGRVSAGPSSQRPGVQTTISHNGSFARPPPPPPSRDMYPSIQRQQTPKVKPEPGLPVRLSPQQTRSVNAVVDLTGDDDDDDDDALEIPPQQFTPSRRTTVQRPPQPQPAMRIPAAQDRFTPNYPLMPGSYPTAANNVGGQHVYGTPIQQPPQYPPQYPSFAQQAANAARHLGSMAGNFARAAAPGPSDQMAQLRYAALGGSRTQPMTFDDSDDEVQFGGMRSIRPEAYAGFEDLYQNRYDEIYNNDPERTKEEINALLDNIRPDEDLPENLLIRTPESMTIKLHKYQELGLTWLKNCEEGTNKGGILADDMGLGKTIQMLSLLVSNKSNDPRCKTTLIVAPVALLRQWEQEIQQKIKPGRHALTVFVHHGQSKKKSFSDLRYYDVVLTTYGTLGSELKKMEKFELRRKNDPQARPLPRERCVIIGPEANWYRVLLDEAQCIKNKTAQTTKGANLINATYRFCMTGTPMMNNFEELYSLIHFLRIKPYCDWTRFRAAFISPLKQNDVARERGMKQLQALCRAIMLRRTKKSTFEGRPILTLPERSTEVDNAAFSEDEKNFYATLQDNMKRQFQKYFRNGTVGQSYTAILVLLLRLRQACCHPHLIKDYSVSAAAGISVETMIDFAKELAPQVIERIRATEGNFECPICLDACTNPAIFIPCGHDCCRDCFVHLADPSNELRQGNEGTARVRCPHCRGDVDPKRITDFDSFKKAHAPELMTEAEKQAIEAEQGSGSDGDSDSDSDSDSDDENDGDPTLGGFIVNDDAEDSETESEAGDGIKGEEDEEKPAGSSRKSKKSKGKRKAKKSSKGKDKDKPNLTLAELKRLSQRNASAKKKYLRRLRKSWVSSAKIDRTLELLTGIMDSPEGERVLIFSQWTSLLDLLEVPMEEKGWGYERYDGSMNAKSRADAVDNFKDPRKNKRIMLVSLKAGNAGLNLNCASQVIILDPFWNPYIEEQAIDRAHRIGQSREVKVHRILVEETVEDRIIQIQEDKRALIGEALDESQAKSISRLGVQELAYLFGITNNRNQAVQYRERQREPRR